MEKFKGTRGCWKISKHSCFTVVSDENRSIATTGGYTDNTRAEQVHIENVANAQLISCAPEMLEMLQSIYDQYERYGHLLNVSPSKIKEIIEKATII